MKICIMLVLGALAISGNCVAAPNNYQVKVLGSGVANAINDAGLVVGVSFVSGVGHAVVWKPGADMRYTERVDLGPGNASGINSAGLVVGALGPDIAFWHAAVWLPGTDTRYTQVFDFGQGQAFGINDKNQIVGFGPGDVEGRVTLWNLGGGSTDLGPGIAFGINNAGQIVGRAGHATLWNPGGDTIDFGSGTAFAVNNAGQVAGYPAFVWTPGLGKRTFGDGYAYGINDAGQVVGWIFSGNSYFAALWNQGPDSLYTEVVNLSFGGAGRGINKSGLIVGQLDNPLRAAIWIPSLRLEVKPTAAQPVGKTKWRPSERFLLKGTGFSPPPAVAPRFKIHWSKSPDALFEPVISLSDSLNGPVVVQSDGTFQAEFSVPANVRRLKQVTAGIVRIEIEGNTAVSVGINVDGSMVDSGCGMFDGQLILSEEELTGGPWKSMTKAERVAAINQVLTSLGGTQPRALANINLRDYYPGITQTAAEIIEDASAVSGINAQVIIAMMQKEQQLIRGGYSGPIQDAIQDALDKAMGRGRSTFQDQVSRGTAGLRTHFDGLSDQATQYSPGDGSTPWRVGDCHWLKPGDGRVDFNDNNGEVTAGVSGWLAPRNAATGALWVYNPVFPNATFGSNYDFWLIWHRFGFGGSSLPNSCAGTFVLRAFSPVRVLVFDSEGRRAGLDLDNGAQLTEIPGSGVTVFPDGAHFINVPGAKDGPYPVVIRGVRGGGDYLLTVDSLDSAGKLVSSDILNSIQDGEQRMVQMSYTRSSGGSFCAAPVIEDCPADIRVGNDPTMCGAKVSWSEPTVTANCGAVTLLTDHEPGDSFPMGTTLVTYTATDSAGHAATCTFRVIVEDKEKPIIDGLSASPNSLGPPNHELVLITLNYVTRDNCGVASTSLTAVSNEVDNGLGDGDKDNDIQFIRGDSHHLYLRAERSGVGTGRTYTVAITCTDVHGNTATQSVNIVVPRRGKP